MRSGNNLRSGETPVITLFSEPDRLRGNKISYRKAKSWLMYAISRLFFAFAERRPDSGGLNLRWGSAIITGSAKKSESPV